MLLNPGKVYSREELLTLIWGYDYFGDSRNIDVHIKISERKFQLILLKRLKELDIR